MTSKRYVCSLKTQLLLCLESTSRVDIEHFNITIIQVNNKTLEILDALKPSGGVPKLMYVD